MAANPLRSLRDRTNSNTFITRKENGCSHIIYAKVITFSFLYCLEIGAHHRSTVIKRILKEFIWQECKGGTVWGKEQREVGEGGEKMTRAEYNQSALYACMEIA
jgi:hypothetical protein